MSRSLSRSLSRLLSRSFKLVPLAAALTFVGCGGNKPKAEEQSSGQVTAPDYPAAAAGPFALTDGQAVGNFDGSILLWNPEVTPEKIRAIADASRAGRVAKAKTLAQLTNDYLPAQAAVGVAEGQLEEVNARIARAEASGFGDPALKQQTKPVAEQWFEGRLSDLAAAGNVTDADRTHAQAMFGAYCEFKLWELATSPLLHSRFNERPTPNQMCEPYYATRGYFTDASLCAVAPNAAYFDCIWKDGILKSTLLIAEMATKTCPGTDVYPSRRAAVEAWVASGLLKLLLADRAPFETTTYAEKMTSYILAANENISSTGLPAKPAYDDLKRCRSAFRRGDYGLPVERWDAAAPFALRDIAETELIDVPTTTYKLLPSSGDAETDKANYDKLARYVKVFGKRYQTVTSEPAASYSDYLFNQKADGTTLEANGKTSECDIVGKAGSQRCTNNADPAFRKFAELKRFLVPAALLTAQNERVAAVDAAKAHVAVSKAVYDANQKSINTETMNGVKAVNEPGAVLFFSGFSVQLVRNEQEAGGLSVVFRMKESQRGFVGCLPAVDGAACSVPLALTKNADALLSVSLERSSGTLILRAPLTDPEAMGFCGACRSGGELSQLFNDVPLSELTGRILEVKMYANRLDDSLDFFTGDAKVFTNALTLAQDAPALNGSVSGDNFPEAHEKLTSSAQ